MLLEAGADPNYKVETMVPYLNPLTPVREYQVQPVVLWLNPGLSEPGQYLSAASGQGQACSVKMLLAVRADPNYQVETMVP
jgi:hypothetical protein